MATKSQMASMKRSAWKVQKAVLEDMKKNIGTSKKSTNQLRNSVTKYASKLRQSQGGDPSSRLRARYATLFAATKSYDGTPAPIVRTAQYLQGKRTLEQMIGPEPKAHVASGTRKKRRKKKKKGTRRDRRRTNRDRRKKRDRRTRRKRRS